MMLHSVGEYEAELKARYREARARMSPQRPVQTVRVIVPPEPAPMPDGGWVPLVPAGTPPAWLRVLNSVAEKHKITRADLVGASRRRKFAMARHEAIFRLVVDCGLSLPKAAQRLGGRDHTTAINSIRAHLRLHPEDQARYDASKSQRLTDEAQKDELIRAYWREGKSIAAICRLLIINHNRVVRVVAGTRQQ